MHILLLLEHRLPTLAWRKDIFCVKEHVSNFARVKANEIFSSNKEIVQIYKHVELSDGGCIGQRKRTIKVDKVRRRIRNRYKMYKYGDGMRKAARQDHRTKSFRINKC